MRPPRPLFTRSWPSAGPTTGCVGPARPLWIVPTLAVAVFLFVAFGTTLPTALTLWLVVASGILCVGIVQLVVGLVMLWDDLPRFHAQFEEDFPPEQ